MKTITVKADVAGTVWKVFVAVGEVVDSGQALLIVESMKMEIPAGASQAGTVREILVKEGDPVDEGQALVVIGLR